MAGHRAAARHVGAAYLDHVLVGVEAHLVVDPHRRDDHPELGGDLAPDGGDPREQGAAGLLIDEGHEPEADRQLERVDRERLERGVARGLKLLRRLDLRRLSCELRRRLEHAVLERPANGHKAAADHEEGEFGETGHQREPADHRAGHERRLLLGHDLVGDVVAEVPLRRGAGHQDAGSNRDQQRGDLGRETVADREQ